MPSLQDPLSRNTLALTPIGHVASDYPDKFGIPRQPGLATRARAILYLAPAFDDPLAVEGLEDFSHLWLTFVFDRSPERWSPRVRPPRLGGNRRIGVFASRSTHRPNRLGLSLVSLTEIEISQTPAPARSPIVGSRLSEHRSRVKLHLRGHDLADATPIVDIKPYLPWTEALPNARAGFAPTPPTRLPVVFADAARRALSERDDAQSLTALIEEVLGQDPRPAYHADSAETGRTYGVLLRDVNVRFRALETRGATFIQVDAIECPAP